MELQDQYRVEWRHLLKPQYVRFLMIITMLPFWCFVKAQQATAPVLDVVNVSIILDGKATFAQVEKTDLSVGAAKFCAKNNIQSSLKVALCQ